MNNKKGGVSSVLHFIPVKLNAKIRNYKGDIQFFGFFKGDFYYTNLREVLNWGWDLKEATTHIDFTNYRVFKCESPYLIYQQIRTHGQMDFLSHSQRYAKCDRGYWKPDEIDLSQESWNVMVETSSPIELRRYMKNCGVVRKEILDRGVDMLQNRVFTIGGHTNNPNGWEHFTNQRSDSHTQKETRDFVTLLDF